jgi:hypothetical protein
VSVTLPTQGTTRTSRRPLAYRRVEWTQETEGGKKRKLVETLGINQFTGEAS